MSLFDEIGRPRGSFGTSDALLDVVDVIKTITEMYYNSERAKAKAWITNKAIAEGRNMPLENLENPTGAKDRLIKNLDIDIRAERPEGYSPIIRNEIFADIRSIVSRVVDLRLSEVKAQAPSVLRQALVQQNNNLIRAIEEGSITLQDAITSSIDNSKSLSPFLPETEVQALQEEAVRELLQTTIVNTPDPLNKAQALEIAQRFLTNEQFTKLQDSVIKQQQDPGKAQSAELGNAMSKTLRNQHLTKKEQSYLSTNLTKELMANISHLPVRGMEATLNAKSEAVRKFLETAYVNDTSSEATMKTRKRELQRLFNTQSLSEIITAFLAKRNISADLKAELRTDLLEATVLEKRLAILSSSYAQDSAQAAIDLGFQNEVLIDYQNPTSVLLGIDQLNANFQENLEKNYATTYLDTHNLQNFLETAEASPPTRLYSLIKEFQDRSADLAFGMMINQLASRNPVIAAAAELVALTGQDYSEQLRTAQKDDREHDPGMTDIVRTAYGENSPIGTALAEMYRLAPVDSPIRKTIESRIDMANGGYISPDIVVMSEQGRANATKRNISLAAAIHGMNLAELKSITPNQEILIGGQTALKAAQIPLLKIQNAGGGTFLLFFGNTFSDGTVLTDVAGNPLTLPLRSIREIAKTSQAKNVKIEKLNTRLASDEVF